jgi:hypothetical protein
MVLAVAALSLAGAPAPAARQEVLEGEKVTVVFPPSLRRGAEEVLDLFPPVSGRLERDLGFEVDFHSTVILVADSGEFRRMTGRSMVVAIAVPGRNLIVVDRSRPISRPHGLETLIKHELCHLLLHSRIPSDRLPRWLDEGVAQWVSEGFSELVLSGRSSALDTAIVSGRTIPLAALSRSFHADERTVILAYQQSLSVVRFMVHKYGTEGLLSVLEALARGESLEAALRKKLSLTTASLEDYWKEHVEGKAVWVALLAAHLYEILFFLGAAMLAAGFVRHMRKRRAKMDALDDPDRED